MIIISGSSHPEQIRKIDNLIMKAVELGHKHYEFLLRWKLKHLKAIRN